MAMANDDSRPDYIDEKGNFSISKWANFQPKQAEFYATHMEKKFVLYGGAKGPGKSYALRAALLLWHVFWAGQGHRGLTTGLFCETYSALADRHIVEMEKWPAFMGSVRRGKLGLGFYLSEMFGGGVIMLRNMQPTGAGSLKERSTRYKSVQYSMIAFDELTEVASRKDFETLYSSLRWPGLPRTAFIAATNPDGVGLEWVRQLWIERDFPKEYIESGMSKEFAFVSAKPDDNKYLDESYWQMLRSLDPDIQKAWIDGDWYVFSGRAFKHFSRETHVVDFFEPPEDWQIWTDHDYGVSSPFAAQWLAKDPMTGRIYVYRELKEVIESDVLQARKIVSLCNERELFARHWADPHFWDNRAGGTSAADVYASEGVHLVKGNNDRAAGKRTISSLLMPLADGKPGLMFTKNCRDTIRLMENLQHDPKNPEDVFTTHNADDHLYDSLRYGLSNEGILKLRTNKVKRMRSPLRTNKAFQKYL